MFIFFSGEMDVLIDRLVFFISSPVVSDQLQIVQSVSFCFVY